MTERLEIDIIIESKKSNEGVKELAGSLSGAATKLGEVEGAISAGLNPSLSSLSGLLVGAANPALLALAAAVAIAAGGIAILGFSLKEAIEGEKVIAQLNAVIKSTQGVAGVTSEAAQDIASSLSELSGVTDDTILSAENLLLTFDKIGKNIFPEVTALALDLSTAFGQDLASSSIMLGKALQDPIQGITALRRVGISFTEAQQAMIVRMSEGGRVAQAQGLIMQLVSRQVSGSAEAMGSTLGGELNKVKNLFSEFGEEIGNAVAPLVKVAVRGMGIVVKEFFEAAKPALTEIGRMFRELDKVTNTKEFRASIKELGRALADLMIGIDSEDMKSFVDAMIQFMHVIAENEPKVIAVFVKIVDAITAITDALADAQAAFRLFMLTSGASGVPGFAGGVHNFGGGLALVGEHGPETVMLPRGSSVIPDGGAMAQGGANNSMQFNGPITFAIQGGSQLTLQGLMEQIRLQQQTAGAFG